jgi:phage baseplate assembly protein W
MPVEIAIPFRLDADRRIAVETNPDKQIRQHVMSLVNTEPGERAAMGDYGVGLLSAVFEPGDESVAVDLGEEIAAALARWEPGVALQSVRGVPGTDNDGRVQVEVQYLRTDAPDTPVSGRRTNVAVITAGGQVSEVLRG